MKFNLNGIDFKIEGALDPRGLMGDASVTARWRIISGVNLNQLEKLEIARQLERCGVDIMEAGLPVSSKGDFEAVRAIARTIKNSFVTGLARATKSDIDIAWDALKDAAEPRLHVFIATSPSI